MDYMFEIQSEFWSFLYPIYIPLSIKKEKPNYTWLKLIAAFVFLAPQSAVKVSWLLGLCLLSEKEYEIFFHE